MYAERYLEDPRHVEVQVRSYAHGTVGHLGERDCTIQRRHQKLVEETPSPAVDDELRDRIGRIAVDAARAAGYRSAGTVEGLLTRDDDYFFMEMNTRIQVEHTVTEMVTGIDLVREQVSIAARRAAVVAQDDIVPPWARDRVPHQREDVGDGFRRPRGGSRRTSSGRSGVRVDWVPRGGRGVGLYDPGSRAVVHDTEGGGAPADVSALEEFVVAG